MNIFAVHYVYDPERSAEVAEIRPTHRKFLASLFEKGELLASGPWGDGEALIVIPADSEAAALERLDADPFYQAGVILERTAKPWKVIYGPWES
ncbi:MAG: YciI family protein [Trueperella sp.]|nr:YciI family protein [Trueperella sp.]